MHLSISNIAWPAAENAAAYRLMSEYGFEGLEIAPTALSERIFDMPERELAAIREEVNSHGIEIVAMQSLLFGHPELTIFGDSETRAMTLVRLKQCIDLGTVLGVRAYVFGSPKNRCMPAHAGPEYYAIAVDFFSEIGAYAADRGGVFCLEPNPAAYGTNFLNTTGEAVDFVRSVRNPGLKVNIDTGTILVNGEGYRQKLREWIRHAGHFHVSEPFLGPIDRSRPEHREIAKLLKDEGYTGRVSIEMKSVPGASVADNVRDALEYVAELYR